MSELQYKELHEQLRYTFWVLVGFGTPCIPAGFIVLACIGEFVCEHA